MTKQQKVINIPKEEIERTTCKWTMNDFTKAWKGECGINWHFTDSHAIFKVNFCLRCGRKVIVAK